MPRHRMTPKKRNHHHLKPRSRGGTNTPENILLIDKAKHDLLHRVFGCRTLGEIIIVLHRLLHAKGYERVESCPICNHTERKYVAKQVARVIADQ